MFWNFLSGRNKKHLLLRALESMNKKGSYCISDKRVKIYLPTERETAFKLHKAPILPDKAVSFTIYPSVKKIYHTVNQNFIIIDKKDSKLKIDPSVSSTGSKMKQNLFPNLNNASFN